MFGIVRNTDNWYYQVTTNQLVAICETENIAETLMLKIERNEEDTVIQSIYKYSIVEIELNQRFNESITDSYSYELDEITIDGQVNFIKNKHKSLISK